MSCEDQSLSHRRSKEVLAHCILQSSSLSNRQSAETVLPMYLKECTFARAVPLIYNGFLTPEFWSARNPVFVQFVVRQNDEATSGENCGHRKTPEPLCISFIIHTHACTHTNHVQTQVRAQFVAHAHTKMQHRVQNIVQSSCGSMPEV